MERTQQVWVAFCGTGTTVLISVPFEEGMTAAQVQASGLSNQVDLPEPLQLGILE